MAFWLVLLLAAARLAPGSCAPSRTSPLTFENFAIKDDTGRIVAELDGGAGGALAAAAWTDCRREGDGLQQCWEIAGRMKRTVRATPDYCVTATASTETDEGMSTTSCYPLDGAQWYGGGEEIPQKWPLNKFESLNHSMVTHEDDNRAIQDPVWFNSKGDLVYVHPGAPLFLSLNDPVESPGKLCLTAEVKAPYRRRPNGYQIKTTVCKLNNAKEAYQYAIDNFLGKPSGYPDETMIRYPVWSTWARYKKNIDETIVREFARQIKEYGFNNSQLEIDDNWESCYGSKQVNKSRFPNMKQLTDDLRAEGFRITIWTHPFIQLDCDDPQNEAASKGYLVLDEDGQAHMHWWDGNATIVDFTKPEAQNWFIKRHRDMMETNGIDGFKFDAGESSWMPQLPKLDTIPSAKDEDYPNLATRRYVETCANFTGLTEVRSAYRSQALPVFVRMIDKDSRWGVNNGLKSLVTTLLQMNMVGYPLVLPDMVGGNEYNGEVANKELFIRWLQANTFMPSIQFSLVPWDYDKNETVEISRNLAKLHADYADVIVAAMKQSVTAGTPVNAPIWWLDPTDEKALQEDSEFLLGESILSAPVMEEGATKRDVYLPKGRWVDGNTCKKYTGPTTIKDYPAPLDTLPWFYIEGSIADKGCGGSTSSAAFAFSTRSLTLAVVSALLALLATHSSLI